MSRAARAAALAVLAAAAAGISGCDRGERELRVAAAASLRPAIEPFARGIDDIPISLSFAGSDEIAAQIRQGVRPDVFASANPDLADTLHREGLLERPRAFATGRLVIAVRHGSRIGSARDLARPGVTVALGSPSVPVGSYARAALARLPRGLGGRVLANVRSEEADAPTVAARVAAGGADAGIVYATDVRASGGRLRAIELPRRARTRVEYAAAVVVGARSPAAGRAFIDGLAGAPAAPHLRRAGFEPRGGGP